MYLESLDIIGFKSYPDKTHIEFSDGLTCIVGPNGVGKSNVAEAIKWVLGTQSTSDVRASAMADVIFNGTKDENGRTKRGRANYAEVSLLFSNEDGFLPINASQVEIKRRITRKGENESISEYFINREECKLKDIKALFYDTGIGKNAYSVLEQGKIAEILTMKAEARRGVFEEAAGISKFKKDEKDAQARLMSADENLKEASKEYERIKRSYNSLKNESEKAENYHKYSKELKELEVKSNMMEFLFYESEISRLASKIKTNTEKLQKITENAKKEELVRKDIKDKFSENERELNSVRIEYSKVSEALNGLNSTLATNDELVKRLIQSKEDFLSHIQESDNFSKSSMQEAEKLRNEKKEKEISLEIIGKKNAENEKNLSQITAVISDAQKRRTQIIDEKNELEKSVSSLYKKAVEKSHAIIENVSFTPDSENYKMHMEAEKVLNDSIPKLSESFKGVIEGKEDAQDEHSDLISLIIENFSKYRDTFPELIDFSNVDDDVLEDAKKIDKELYTALSRIESLNKESVENSKTLEDGDYKKNELLELKVSIQSERSALQSELNNIDSKIDFLIKNVKNDGIKKEDEKKRIDALLADIEEKGNISKKLKIGIEENKKKLTELTAKLSSLTSIKEEIQKKLSDAESKELSDSQLLRDEITAGEVNLENCKNNKNKLETDFYERYGENLDTLKNKISVSENDRKDTIKSRIKELRNAIDSLGSINHLAADSFKEVKIQYDLLKTQLEDCQKAREDIKIVLDEIQTKSSAQFLETFNNVNAAYKEIYSILQPGGSACLELLDEEDVLSSGVDIKAEPGGKVPVSLMSLSGGEKEMTAIALLFALYSIKPSPFCILDEIDAHLDDLNISRIIDVLDNFRDNSQFVIITHNKRTVLAADTLIGVTQFEKGVSTVIGYDIHNENGETVFKDKKNGKIIDIRLD